MNQLPDNRTLSGIDDNRLDEIVKNTGCEWRIAIWRAECEGCGWYWQFYMTTEAGKAALEHHTLFHHNAKKEPCAQPVVFDIRTKYHIAKTKKLNKVECPTVHIFRLRQDD